MKDNEMSYEEIMAHVAKLDLKQFEPGGQQHFTAAAVKTAPADVLKRVCDIYRGIRPILNVVANIPFVPPPIKNALKTFISLMDTLCP